MNEKKNQMPHIPEKEAQVLELMCLKFSEQEIADSLLKSVSTVRSQVYSIIDKFVGKIPGVVGQPKKKDVINFVKDNNFKPWEKSEKAEKSQEAEKIDHIEESLEMVEKQVEEDSSVAVLLQNDAILQQVEEIIGPIPEIESEELEELEQEEKSAECVQSSVLAEYFAWGLRRAYNEKLIQVKLEVADLAIEGVDISNQKLEHKRLQTILLSMDEIAEILREVA
jgi:hypothetical protein